MRNKLYVALVVVIGLLIGVAFYFEFINPPTPEDTEAEVNLILADKPWLAEYIRDEGVRLVFAETKYPAPAYTSPTRKVVTIKPVVRFDVEHALLFELGHTVFYKLSGRTDTNTWDYCVASHRFAESFEESGGTLGLTYPADLGSMDLTYFYGQDTVCSGFDR